MSDKSTYPKNKSSQKIFDMIDLFYANKHMYEKLRRKGMRKEKTDND